MSRAVAGCTWGVTSWQQGMVLRSTTSPLRVLGERPHRTLLVHLQYRLAHELVLTLPAHMEMQSARNRKKHREVWEYRDADVDKKKIAENALEVSENQ